MEPVEIACYTADTAELVASSVCVVTPSCGQFGIAAAKEVLSFEVYAHNLRLYLIIK